MDYKGFAVLLQVATHGYLFDCSFGDSSLDSDRCISFCYLLLRNGWHSIFRLHLLSIQRKLRSSTPFSVITAIGGRQFLLDMLINSFIFYSHLFIQNHLHAICCSRIIHSLLSCFKLYDIVPYGNHLVI